jgi:hypothetical protein
MVNRAIVQWIAACLASALLLAACGGSNAPGTAADGTHLLADSTTSTSTNLLKNAGFESIGEGWGLEFASTPSSTPNIFINDPSNAHSGSYAAWLYGGGSYAKGINQTITIPSGAGKVYLQFWYYIASMTASSNDTMVVGITPASGGYVNLVTLTGAMQTVGWKQSDKYDLSAYVGQTVTVRFYANTPTNYTNFVLDDLVIASDSTTTTTSDSTVFTGNRSNYSIVKTATGYTVTDKTGSEATRTLGNVQSLKFNDVTINLGIGDKVQTISSADLNSLIELYIAYLGRIPDADGLSYWIDQFNSGHTLDDIGKTFYSAAIQYPDLTGYSSTMTDADFVRIVYKNVLGRTSVDADGLNYWTTALASGAQTRGTLVKTILGSAHTFKGDATYGAVADLLDNKIKVGIAYAVQQGITFNTAADSVSKGIAIAAATTSTSTATALGLYGIVDSSFSLAPSCVTSGTCVASQYTLSPTSLDFGTVNVGDCGTKTFAVQSASGSALATGTASTSSPFSISAGSAFSVSNGTSSTVSVKFCPTAAGTFSDKVSLATSASFSGANAVTLTGTAATTSSSPFAGTYTVSGGGVTVTFVVDSKGTVTSCASGTLVVCSGSVSSSGSFTITGNDGQQPVDISATLTGSITTAGVVSGTYTGKSVSSGSLSGSFSGSKSGGGTTGGGTGTGSSGSYMGATGIPGFADFPSPAMSSTTTGTMFTLTAGGDLWGWGAGDHGSLGNGQLADNYKASLISSGWRSISLDNGFVPTVFGIKTDNSLWGWGGNGQGLIFTTQSTDIATPVKIGDGYAKISAGWQCTYAIKTDSSLWAWGRSCNSKSTPTPIQIGTGFAEVATDGYGMIGIKQDGTLWIWGSNTSRLQTTGYPNSGMLYKYNFDAPTQVGTDAGYKSVVFSENFVAALKSDGTLYAWGQNYYGLVGNGEATKGYIYVPYKVGTGFTQISGGYSYAAAIKSDGSLWAWGTLKSWEVSSAADVVTTPTKIGSGFVKVVATFDQAYAIASDGSFWGWGRNVDLGFVSAPIDFASSPIKLN